MADEPLGSQLLPSVTSTDVEQGRVALDGEVARYVCPRCHAELEDRYHLDCPRCGAWGCPVSRCRGCGGALRSEPLRFVSVGPSGGGVAKALPGLRCPACRFLAVEEHELGALAELAASPALVGSQGVLEVLPEAGYFTPERLEVLADADVGGPGEPEQIEKLRDGMRLRVGSPSAVFDAALAVVTDHDPGDIFSPTLSVVPG
ncbi:MAG TPA: hypothetical protein VNN80_03830, partial [Polyangiaceae bacterium]|nr:hypothetical protein [Polyangiaceae bacterium]